VELKPRTARRLLAGGVLLLAGYYAVWGGEYSAFHLLRLDAEQARAHAELRDLRTELDSLEAHARMLETDDATIERIARERFGMVRDGELLYRFVPVGPDAPPTRPPGVDTP
jgi:cell division protein FtsB